MSKAIDTVPSSEASAIAPLLDLAILQAKAHAAYAYRFEHEKNDLTLVAFVGPALSEKKSFLRGITPTHWNRKVPIVLHSGAGSDERFAAFPEFASGQFDGVISVPLIDSGESVGIANFCRRGDTPLAPSALSLLMNLSLPLGALLTASTLRYRLHKSGQDLADRRVVERAKGLLQARFQMTEEEAYFWIRRRSRRFRTPMREIANRVIATGAAFSKEALEIA